MSGGVDSSVAAALLKEQGNDVTGVTMQLWPRAVGNAGLSSCCGLDAIDDARRVAAVIGIPHYVVNMRDAFETAVIDNFISEYRSGRTPNPCVRCNQIIKFDILLKKVIAMGADKLATGHYARIESREQRAESKEQDQEVANHQSRIIIYRLLKGVDKKKDQSYFLWTFTQEQLAKTLLPLGDLTKEQVRDKARSYGLPVAEKAESQEICFVPEDRYREFLAERGVADKPGPIVNASGAVIGTHSGITGYTVGQRKGLGIASDEPLYVVAIDIDKNQVVAGPEAETYTESIVANQANYVSGSGFTQPTNVMVRIRYNAAEVPARLTPIEGDKIRLDFDRPHRAVAPGQSVVLYNDSEVLGGAVIL